MVFISPSGRVVIKHWTRTVPNPSFNTSVIGMKGVLLNLGTCRTGFSSRMHFSQVLSSIVLGCSCISTGDVSASLCVIGLCSNCVVGRSVALLFMSSPG